MSLLTDHHPSLLLGGYLLSSHFYVVHLGFYMIYQFPSYNFHSIGSHGKYFYLGISVDVPGPVVYVLLAVEVEYVPVSDVLVIGQKYVVGIFF